MFFSWEKIDALKSYWRAPSKEIIKWIAKEDKARFLLLILFWTYEIAIAKRVREMKGSIFKARKKNKFSHDWDGAI